MKEFKKAAVIGAGVMGSGIAGLLANRGVKTVLLDIVPFKLTESECEQGLTLADKQVRNRIIDRAAARIRDERSMILEKPENIDNLIFGNLDDDLALIRDADIVIEAVPEDVEIKRATFTRLAEHIGDGAYLASNTSGISVNMMSDMLPQSLAERFLITHFFNPPRYMKLLEVVPSRHTAPQVIADVAAFGENLGKGVIICKDTYSFVANRVANYTFGIALDTMNKYKLTPEETDQLAGAQTGRPRTGIFRLFDMVGLDMIVLGAKYRKTLRLSDREAALGDSDIIERMVAQGILGDKVGSGFYKKADGKKYVIEFDTLEYRPAMIPPPLPGAPDTEGMTLAQRLEAYMNGTDKYSLFVWEALTKMMLFCASMIPEIADDYRDVDRAMRWGFNWEAGPFEMWDMFGLERSVARLRAEGELIPPLVEELLAAGNKSFY